MTDRAQAAMTVMTAAKPLSFISRIAAASEPPFTERGNTTAASFVENLIYAAA